MVKKKKINIRETFKEMFQQNKDAEAVEVVGVKPRPVKYVRTIKKGFYDLPEYLQKKIIK